MQFRSFLLGISLFAPSMAFASEGLIYAFVYECGADDVNQNMVQACSTRYPDLSAAASEAISKWRTRNSDRAKRAKDACDAELQKMSKAEAVSEVSVRTRMAEIKAEINANFVAELQRNGRRTCVDALQQLSEGGGLIDFK